MASVSLKNVKKIYGKNTVAVHDFNLEIADKEFIVFVGPSGCGKSTTLRMIAGLEEISEGTIEIGGKVVNDLQPKDRDIAMVFQNYALYPHLTVFENMAFALRLQKVPVLVDDDEAPAEEGKEKPKKIKYVKLSNDEIYNRVTAAAEVLGISDYLLRRPRELSGGQRQRVAIGRAMVRDSQVFLMDEPLSNLDAKLRNQMRAEIILLRKKIDTTFIYVTHDQTEAMTLGDRIVIMKDGYIQQVGTPSQVFEMPDNLFVAEFIGAPKMNTIPTRLEREGDEYFVTPFGVKMPVDGSKGEALKAKDVQPQDIILGVRPEHVTLSNSKNPGAVLCQIRVNEMMGSELHLHVTTESGDSLIIRVPTMDIAPQQLAALVPGVRIYVTFKSKVMHFFNAENEWNVLSDAPPIQYETAPADENKEDKEDKKKAKKEEKERAKQAKKDAKERAKIEKMKKGAK